MKKSIMLTVLALSIGAAQAQPPELAPIPVAKQAQDYAREERERNEQARRAPDTMLQHFVWSMGANNYEAAALCVAGADNTPWLRSLQEKSRREQNISLQYMPLFKADQVQGDRFTARVVTMPGIGDSLLREEMEPLLGRVEQVDLVREGEFWKIVPRPQPKAPADATQMVGQARDENDGFLNQWARLLLGPPTPDEQTRQERAEIARLARRAPDTMLQHFVTAINANDLESAAGDVVGGEATVWLRRLQDNLQHETPEWKIVATPLFDGAKGEQFTARMATTLRMSDENSTPTQNLLARFEQVEVRRDDGEWRIVPRAPLPQLEFDGQNVAIETQAQLDELQAQMAPKVVEHGRDERDGFINQWARIMPQPRDMMMRVTSRTSLSNLKQLGLGVLQLMQDYDETYAFTPETFGESVQPYVKSQVLLEIPMLDETRTSRYQFNPNLAGKSIAAVARPQLTPMIYEPGKGPHGLDYRFDGQAAVCFADGHAALVSPEDANKLVWEIKPPPSG